jgi:hypothetical protein
VVSRAPLQCAVGGPKLILLNAGLRDSSSVGPSGVGLGRS